MLYLLVNNNGGYDQNNGRCKLGYHKSFANENNTAELFSFIPFNTFIGLKDDK